MDINGIEGLSVADVNVELSLGGKFIMYQYCISILIMTFRRPTDVYFVKVGESATAKGLPFVLLSLVLGWWGFPWGPIYTIATLIANLSGGNDVTAEVIAAFSDDT
jgi:hypothetical protein